MKVLGISSSARRDGNTAILLRKVLEVLNKAGIETELVQLAGQVIEPCKACWACGGQENCVHQKDIFRELFVKMNFVWRVSFYETYGKAKGGYGVSRCRME